MLTVFRTFRSSTTYQVQQGESRIQTFHFKKTKSAFHQWADKQADRDGENSLRGIERLQFSDKVIFAEALQIVLRGPFKWRRDDISININCNLYNVYQPAGQCAGGPKFFEAAAAADTGDGYRSAALDEKRQT